MLMCFSFTVQKNKQTSLLNQPRTIFYLLVFPSFLFISKSHTLSLGKGNGSTIKKKSVTARKQCTCLSALLHLQRKYPSYTNIHTHIYAHMHTYRMSVTFLTYYRGSCCADSNTAERESESVRTKQHNTNISVKDF